MRSSATSRVSDIGKSSQITAHQAIANDAMNTMNTMSRGNSHALAAPAAMMRATPSSAAAAPEQCASSCARDRGGDISHSARVMPTMTAVSKPNNIPARLATMMTLMCATPSVDFRSARCCVRALGRPSEMLKTNYCNVSALSFRRCRYNAFLGLRTGDSIGRAPLRYRFTQ
jgi:hypothetical protein